MKLEFIKEILVNRVATLEQSHHKAFEIGDLELYEKIDAELNETKTTLSQIEKSINQQGRVK